jgi:hypothetical protein
MFIKTSFICGQFLLCALIIQAQSFEINENKPVEKNGFEYGWIIKNEQLKTAGGEEYSRYELSLYVANKSGCSKIYADPVKVFSYDEHNILATFNCVNANGKRFTSKSGAIKAKDFYIAVKRTINKKDTVENIKAGYIFRNGEMFATNIIILVPKGERPVIKCTAGKLYELE